MRHNNILLFSIRDCLISPFRLQFRCFGCGVVTPPGRIVSLIRRRRRSWPRSKQQNFATKKLIKQSLIIFLTILSRFLPHLWNFTAVGAAGFWVAYLSRDWKKGVLASWLIMLISDSLIGFYYWPIMVAVYASWAVYSLSGQLVNQVNKAGSFVWILAGSWVFFLVTNTAVWLFSQMYAKDLIGWWLALVAGLPFYRNMLFGDIIYIALPLIVVFGIKKYQFKIESIYGRQRA